MGRLVVALATVTMVAAGCGGAAEEPDAADAGATAAATAADETAEVTAQDTASAISAELEDLERGLDLLDADMGEVADVADGGDR